MIPTLCGKNKIYIPSAGCGSCESISEEELVGLTPIECYEPLCSSSEVCVGTVCCMQVSCDPIFCDESDFGTLTSYFTVYSMNILPN